ncbi:MAG: lasso peptide biosynthesis B2 protein [Proteobacteria bacterium]|nr:lasso peptide biosynthesis B2 protein [Pseudomonadota bacterium]
MFSVARTLSATEWRYLIVAWIALPLIDLRLRRQGYARTKAWLDARSLRARAARPTLAAPQADWFSQRIARVIGIAARRTPWPTTCLRQALLLHHLLARRGIDSELRIGVRTASDGFAAHAWVERHGAVLIGGDESARTYSALI